MVYISEAHASDSRRPNREVIIANHTSDEERRAAAASAQEGLGLNMPILIDDMEDSTARAYDAKPDRLFLVGIDGTIAFASGPGPRGYVPRDLVKAIEAYSEAQD